MARRLGAAPEGSVEALFFHEMGDGKRAKAEACEACELVFVFAFLARGPTRRR